MAGEGMIKAKLTFVALLSFLLGSVLLNYAFNHGHLLFLRMFAALLGSLGLVFALLSIYMAISRISYGHTLVTAYSQIILMTVLLSRCHSKFKICAKSWKFPRSTQEKYIRDIINMNRDTAYVKDFGLGSVTSMKDLREKHPLTDYERYRPYIDRMAKGEQGILSMEKPMRFTLTSGTTGQSKMMPYVKSYNTRVYGTLTSLTVHENLKNFGLGSLIQRDLNLYTTPKSRYTEGGTVMAPASLINANMRRLLVLYTTPAEGFQIRDPDDSIYVHLLFGLRDRNLRFFKGRFTSYLMSAMRLVEYSWPDIVRDIEKGTVSTKNVPPEIHRALVQAMGNGHPERAEELRREFQKGFDGIMKRVWPHLERVEAIDSVGIKGQLQDSYVKGVPFFSRYLAATEGAIGFNLWPLSRGKDEYVLMPDLTVFEFIPENVMHQDQPDTLFIDELQVGGVYEVVVTQLFGIYRFRYGDVVRVTRYHLNTPVVEFMYRSGQMLNVHSEKMDQQTVQNAIEDAVSRWPHAKLREYAVAESALITKLGNGGTHHRPFYIIFIELDQMQDPKEMTCSSHLKTVDEELCRHSFTYNSFREKGCIAPPSVHVVKLGSFDTLRDHVLTQSDATANQYKVPRKLRTPQALKLMLECSILKSCSNGC